MRSKKKGQQMSCIYIQNVPMGLKSHFKAYCALQGRTITEVILEFMQQKAHDAREKISKEEKEKAPKSEGAVEGSKVRIRRQRRKSIDKRTIELLEEGPKTLEELLESLVRGFPDHKADTLRRTTKRRLHGYIEKTYGINICRDENDVYSIEQQ
jgi:hypothetical protein